MTHTPEKIQQWVKWDHDFHWHPFTQTKIWEKQDPLIITEGDGNFLIDAHGKRYLDGVSSLWTNVHGHNHAVLNQALQNQLGKIAHTTLLGLAHPGSIELAKDLIAIAPKNLGKVFFSDNGSTAVEVALKMAFQYWQQTPATAQVPHPKLKHKFMSLEHGYHGDTLGSVSVGGIGIFHEVYRPLLFGSIQLPSPHAYRDRLPLLLEKTEEIFKKFHTAVAAVVVEPKMQGASGMRNAPDGYLKGLEKLCRQYGVLLIADEVATGFGRTGKMFACEWEGVEPDFLCLAKGITGGYLPLAATLTTNQIYSAFYADPSEFKTFFHGHTYTGNPLACAVALANLGLFRQTGFWDSLTEKIAVLEEKLAVLKDHPHVGDIRQVGFMVGIEIVKDRAAKLSFSYEQMTGYKICMKAREHGVLIRPLGDVIVLMPPLSITVEEIDLLVSAVVKSLSAVLA